MRHPIFRHLPPGSPSHKDPETSGFTLIESLVAIIIVSLTVVSVLPPIFWATATRVQNRRAEQAVQLAQAEIERVRALVERGQYGPADLPPTEPNLVDIRVTTPNIPPAPSSASGILRTATPGCTGTNQTLQPTAVTQFIYIDSDAGNGCKPEFMVQVFRSTGSTSDGSPAGTVPDAFTMGVRVYAQPAINTVNRGEALGTIQARLRGSSGIGQQGTRPMAVLYGTVVKSRSGGALSIYKKLCEANKDC